MRILFLAISLFTLSTQFAYCQHPGLEKEQWADKPSVYAMSDRYSQEPAFTVLNKLRLEFIDNTDNKVSEYFTLHKIIHLNNDHGIESYNKIYISVNDFSEISDIHARTILPGGKIVELDKANIKDLKDEDGSLYKIFAFEGLEKGCDIEYYYTVQRGTSYFGKLRIQDQFPSVETKFELVYPYRLIFETKLYNCHSEPQTDSLPNDKGRLSLHFGEIPGVEDEKYASYHVNLARVEYKLSYNNAKSRGERLFTWNELARRIFTAYGTYTDKEIKKVNDLIADNHWDKLSGDSTKIITVENYIKKNINYRKDLEGEGVNNIEAILKSKTSNAIGLMRLYGAVYRQLAIEYQFVMAADRDEVIIDRNFENWDNCDYQLLYFPVTHNFLSPTKQEYRYPWIFPSWGNTNALFCKNVSIGSMNSAIAEIKAVPLKNYLQSYNNLDARLTINPSMDSLLMDMKFIYGGYVAPVFRNGFDFLTGEQKQAAFKDFSKSFIGTETILSSDLENASFEDGNTSKPFILHLKVKSGDLLERAGNKLLLKIGMVIGPQVEMYQEKERRLPISVDYAHYEQRKIEVTIPEGYVIRNPDDIKMKQIYLENNVQTMGFVSDYTIKGNLLTIDIMEDYRNTSYPVSQYEDFRRIINTSSDFNKVVLILEKK